MTLRPFEAVVRDACFLRSGAQIVRHYAGIRMGGVDAARKGRQDAVHFLPVDPPFSDFDAGVFALLFRPVFRRHKDGHGMPSRCQLQGQFAAFRCTAE